MDSYLRGEDTGSAEPSGEPREPVRAPYRDLVGLIWVVGVVLLVLAPFAGAQGVAAVYLVTHVFLAGFVRVDILSLRRQGLDWGASRHVWFAATLVLPLVAPAYYLYAGRRIERENERREAAAGDDVAPTPDGDGVAPPAGGDAERTAGNDEERAVDDDATAE